MVLRVVKGKNVPFGENRIIEASSRFPCFILQYCH